MGIQTVHQIAPVVITNDAGTHTIPDITSLSINTGTETFREVVAGSVIPQLSRITRVRPTFQFTTKAVKVALDAFGVVASCSNGSQTAVAYLAKRICSGIAGAGNHEKFTMPNYIVVPRTFTCRYPNDAEITYEVFSVIDALLPATPILERDTGENLPATIGTNDRWAMHDAAIKSVSVSGKLSITIDFGVTLIQESADDDTADTFVGVDTSQPRVTITGRTVDWYGEIGSVIPTVDGVEAAHANTELLFKKRGDLETAITHIQLTCAGLAYAENVGSGQGNGPTEHSIIIEPHDDGSLPIFDVDTAHALSP